MNCFEAYIGVGLHCQTTDSVSGKYITDLPSVSLQNIDSIADSSQSSFIGVFEDVEKRAISRISKDILAYLKSQYTLKKSLTTYTTKGVLGDSVSSQSKKHGVNVYTYYDESELLMFHVSKVYLYALEIQDTTIYIYSGDDLLYSQQVTTEAGWNEIYINKYFDTLDITVVYDDSNFEDIATYELDTELCGCLDICNECDVYKRGVSFTNVSTITKTNDTKGLKVDVSLRCSYDAIICANIDLYADAYLYALGVELMRERIYSDRVNRYTTVDKKKAQELLELFTQDYTEFLETANSAVNLRNDDCIECVETVGLKWQHP